MSDRELLELAAKAAGMESYVWRDDRESMFHYNSKMMCWYRDSYSDLIEWNPLTDDGDALRLAVKLHIGLDVYNGHVEANWCDFARSEERFTQEFCDESFEGLGAKQSATRRAIVRAAAEIGKSL